MKQKTGCAPLPSFYFVVIVSAIIGFFVGGEIKDNLLVKVLGAVILGSLGAVIAIDTTCYDEKGNVIMVNAAGCPIDKPYPITDFGGKWTGECSETIVMS